MWTVLNDSLLKVSFKSSLNPSIMFFILSFISLISSTDSLILNSLSLMCVDSVFAFSWIASSILFVWMFSIRMATDRSLSCWILEILGMELMIWSSTCERPKGVGGSPLGMKSSVVKQAMAWAAVLMSNCELTGSW